MLWKVCKRCGAMIPYPKTYCDKCQTDVDAYREQMKAKYNQNYNKKRDPKYIRFYNSQDWKILSAKKMADQSYKCERCGTLATEVHHIKPIQTPDGWELRLDYDNLMAVCVTCHNKEHDRFRRRKKK